jgi:hypothetical protein
MDDWYEDGRPHVPDGRPAASGPSGTIHLSFRSGSRGSGASASAAFEYVSRSGQFEDRELDEALHVESDHMPAWAADSPEKYWDAADLFERANGRLYVSADFALPRGLELEDRAWREQERRAYWPFLAWRWAAAAGFALLASIAAGAGYVWAARPDADEIAYLRSRNAFADALETRMVRMTPAERRQLDALLKLPTTPK